MDGELREKIIGFLSASGIFEGTEERGTAARDYSSGTLMDRLEKLLTI